MKTLTLFADSIKTAFSVFHNQFNFLSIHINYLNVQKKLEGHNPEPVNVTSLVPILQFSGAASPNVKHVYAKHPSAGKFCTLKNLSSAAFICDNPAPQNRWKHEKLGTIIIIIMMMRNFLFGLVLVVVVFLVIACSGRFLVIDQPRRSDAILVLAGETDKRPARGLVLLRQGYGSQLILDVPADAMIFNSSELQLARQYVGALPDSQAISLCPIHGLSTEAEALEASQCLKALKTPARQNVLLVTSDFHTRRALSTFKKEAPDFTYSVAASFDPLQYGTRWWQHREWAKVYASEWLRLAWWELIDRWRNVRAR